MSWISEFQVRIPKIAFGGQDARVPGTFPGQARFSGLITPDF